MSETQEKTLVRETIVQKPIYAELVLKKADLSGKSKWTFIYNKKIEATIEDDTFLEGVRKGIVKNLYEGVKIPCTLRLKYDLDEKYNIVPGSEQYTILRVVGDIALPKDAKKDPASGIKDKQQSFPPNFFNQKEKKNG